MMRYLTVLAVLTTGCVKHIESYAQELEIGQRLRRNVSTTPTRPSRHRAASSLTMATTSSLIAGRHAPGML